MGEGGLGLPVGGGRPPPHGDCAMGIVSNLGASGYLFISGLWRRALLLPLVFAAIGLCLVAALT